MNSLYTDIILNDMRTDAAIDALREAIRNGKCSYKAAKAYIILDTEMFGYTYDKRRVKWAKRYLKTHNVDFKLIKLIAVKAADSVSDLWKMTEEGLLQRMPFLVRLL